jgi:probable phosphoglycerate mutase
MQEAASVMAAKLYLVRHGETEWSLSGQHTGRSDIPLTANGEEEARRLVPWLKEIQFSVALCSPRQRARRTCDLAGLGRLAEVEPDLAEWDYGDYEGLRSPDIAQQRRGWNIFADGGPNGESPADVSARADRLISRLEALDGNVALFSHGHFSRVLTARWLGFAVVAGQRFMLDTGSLSILRDDPRHPELRVIALWNAVPVG